MSWTREKRDRIRDEMLSIERNGGVTPDRVVAAASEETSAMHDQFEWDDSVAGAKWRIEQARELIVQIHFEVTVNETVVVVPRYTRDPSAACDEQGYVSVEALVTDPDRARAALQMEMSRIEALLGRAQRLAEALMLGPQLVGLVRRVQQFRRTIERRPSA